MKGNNYVSILALTSALTFSATTAAAEYGPYIGASVGQSKSDLSKSEVISVYEGLDVSAEIDDSDIGFKIYGGYRINQYLAVEAGYTDLGKFHSHAHILSSGGIVASETEGYSVNASVLGILPINEHFEVFGRAGVGGWEVDYETRGAATASGHDAGFSPIMGIGAAFNINEKIALRAEYERYFDNETGGDIEMDIDLLTVGLIVKF